jgi:hypothetical protein
MDLSHFFDQSSIFLTLNTLPYAIKNKSYTH